jgi:hypothetical protein
LATRIFEDGDKRIFLLVGANPFQSGSLGDCGNCYQSRRKKNVSVKKEKCLLTNLHPKRKPKLPFTARCMDPIKGITLKTVKLN